MKSIVREIDTPGDGPSGQSPAAAATQGIRPAREGVQPIKDLASFLELLPDFGDDAAGLREAIAEERALRRAAAEADGC